MSNLKATINEVASGLYKAEIIDKQTLRSFTEDDAPTLRSFTPEEIQMLRKQFSLSQPVFARYLNISPAMVKSLEQGARKPQGAVLKLLNIAQRHGLSSLS